MHPQRDTHGRFHTLHQVDEASGIRAVLDLLRQHADAVSLLGEHKDTPLRACARSCNITAFQYFCQKPWSDIVEHEASDNIPKEACTHWDSARIACFLRQLWKGHPEYRGTVTDTIEFLVEEEKWDVLTELASLEPEGDWMCLEQEKMRKWLVQQIGRNEGKGIGALMDLMGFCSKDTLRSFRAEQGRNIVHVAAEYCDPVRLESLRTQLEKEEWMDLLQEFDFGGKMPQHVAPGCNYQRLKQLGADRRWVTRDDKLRWIDLKVQPLPGLQRHEEVKQAKEVLGDFKLFLVLYGSLQEASRDAFKRWYQTKYSEGDKNYYPLLLIPYDRGDDFGDLDDLGYKLQMPWDDPKKCEEIKLLLLPTHLKELRPPVVSVLNRNWDHFKDDVYFDIIADPEYELQPPELN